MEGFWRLLSQIKNYKKNFTFSIICNIMYSVFTIISIPLLVPFFNILFDRVNPNPVLPADGNINDWTKYYISTYINEYGKETTLLYVCIILIIVFFFKNAFRYGALYAITPMRYGIIYDLRKKLFSKYLDLPLSFYSNERKGALLSSITVDVQEIEWSILSVIEVIFTCFVQGHSKRLPLRKSPLRNFIICDILPMCSKNDLTLYIILICYS